MRLPRTRSHTSAATCGPTKPTVSTRAVLGIVPEYFHGPANKRRPRFRPNRARTKCASPIQPELIPCNCRYPYPAQTSLTRYCLLLCFLSPAPCKPTHISLINSNIDPRIRMMTGFLRIAGMTGGSVGYPAMLFTRCGREFGSRRGEHFFFWVQTSSFSVRPFPS